MISNDKLEQYKKILDTKICLACSLGLLIPDDEDIQQAFKCSHCGARFDFRTDDKVEDNQLLKIQAAAPDAEVVETYRIHCEIFRESRFRRIVQAATAFNILDHFDSQAAADIYRKMGDGDKVAPLWFDAFLGRMAADGFNEETESLLEWFDEEWLKAFSVGSECMLRPEVEAIRDVVSDALSDVRPEHELPADLVPVRQRAVSQIATILSVIKGYLDDGEYYVPPDHPEEDDSDSQDIEIAQRPSDGICLACGHVNVIGSQTCSMCGESVKQEGR